MFKVCLKQNLEIFTVYDVRCDSSGYPQFLIYNTYYGTWEYKSAKHFKPVL